MIVNLLMEHMEEGHTKQQDNQEFNRDNLLMIAVLLIYYLLLL